MIVNLVNAIFYLLQLTLLIRVLLSWFPHDASHSVISVIYQITDPLLKPFQDWIPAYKIGLDVSPILAFLLLKLLHMLLLRLLVGF